MKKTRREGAEEISALGYTEFVATVNQWNVPPGAFNTISKWSVFGQIAPDSSILEAACTTGFSGRELARRTGASVVGFDLCAASVAAAKANASQYAPEARIDYHVADIMKFEPGSLFSHAVTGAALRFFPQPDRALDRMVSWLKPDGLVLSCEFYCTGPIPKALLDRASSAFGIAVTQASYKSVMEPYRKLSVVYEEQNELVPETPIELKHYCDSTISHYLEDHPSTTEAELSAIRSRLLEIKDVSNRLRPYQRYNVLVHRCDSRCYPRRYTELF